MFQSTIGTKGEQMKIWVISSMVEQISLKNRVVGSTPTSPAKGAL